MITETQKQAGKEVLMKYLLPDCLKPEYNGMTAYELAGKVIEASEDVVHEEMLEGLSHE